MNTFYQEYQNQHEHRKYPFADNASLMDTSGNILSMDYIVDAMLYPLDVEGPFHFNRIDSAKRVIELTANGSVCGTGTWQKGDTTVNLYDTSGFTRHIGLVVLGSSSVSATTVSNMLFNPDATQLTPTCVVALNQKGVRGLITDDDELSTGTVQLEGRNGVKVHSYYDSDNKAIVRIDIYGCPPPDDATCNTNPLIKQIKVENVNCPMITGTPGGDGLIYINSSPGFDANALCLSKRLPDSDGVLPSEQDACDDEYADEELEIECVEDSAYTIPVHEGRIHLIAPSTLDKDNPVKIVNSTTPGEIPDLSRLASTGNITTITRRVEHLFKLGIKDRGLITLKLKGGVR